MTNIHKVRQNVQQLANDFIPGALHRRFRTGITAFGLTEFQSVNGNGRRLHHNRYTGETRTRRAAHDGRFPKLLLRLLVKMYLPKDGWLQISLDHSKFGKFNVAVLALSVGHWWLLHNQFAVVVRQARSRHQHPKKKLSWVRLVWEYWQRLCTAPLLAIASG